MPLPAVIAVPALISGLISLVGEGLKFYLHKYGLRLFLAPIFIGLYVVLITAFISKINTGFSSLLASLPTNSFSLAGLSLIPNNAITCATIIMSAKVAQISFYFALGIVKIKLKAK